MSSLVWWILLLVGVLIVFLPPVIAAGKGEKIEAERVGLEVTLPSMVGLVLFTIAAVKLFPSDALDFHKEFLLLVAITCSSIISLTTMFNSLVRIRWQGF